MSDTTPFLSHFSPQWTDPEYLEAIFVQREDLLAESVSLMRESVLTPNKHHLLFIGPRGAGKTHLVTLIHHRLKQDDELSDRIRFAWLNEDETATNFLRLLVQIYRSLSERYPDEFPASTLSALMGQDPVIVQEKLGDVILQSLQGRTLVCLMENMDSLFRYMDEGEQRTWRAFVQNNPVFATTGTAQTLFDGVSDHEKPFFGFFDTRHLKPLSLEESRTLLENIARLKGRDDLREFLQTSTGHARVAAIRALAGGNPRLYLVFSDLLVNAQALDDLVRPFEEMVDRQLTTYYQERLRWLSPLQREIVQFLCRTHGPVAVKTIADGLFTTHNSITGQLKQLRNMRYLDAHPRGREVLYELTEPLMRLALQVKETHDRKPLALIVDFLRVWHEASEIKERLSKTVPSSPGYAYFAAAHILMESGPNLRHEILRQNLDSLPTEEYSNMALSTAKCLAEESNLSIDWLKFGQILNARKEWNSAILAFTKVISADNVAHAELIKALLGRSAVFYFSDQASKAVSDLTAIIDLHDVPIENVAVALHNRGLVYSEMDQLDKAIEDYSRIIELPDVPVEHLVKALNNRGTSYGQLDHLDKAIEDCSRIIELPNVPIENLVKALKNRGFAYRISEQLDKSIEDYSRIIELSEASINDIAIALHSRGLAQSEQDQLDKAIEDYSKIIELPDVSVEHIAIALHSRGLAYIEQDQLDKAIEDYSRIIELPNIPVENIAMALNNRGNIHGQLDQLDKAIEDYSKIIELPDVSVGHIASALHNRGLAQSEQDQLDKAIEDYSRIIELPNIPVDNIAIALNNRGVVYSELDKFDTAIEDYSKIIELPDVSVEHIASALTNRGSCYGQLDQIDKAIEDYSKVIDMPDASLEDIANSLHNRGVAYSQTGQIDKAIEDYSKVIDNPNAALENILYSINNRIIAFYKSNNSALVLDDLKKLISLSNNTIALEIIHYQLHDQSHIIIESVFSHTTDFPKWKQASATILDYFFRFNELSQLGNALVKHIPKVGKSPLNHAAWDAWVEAWVTARATLSPEDQDKLEIALRLLRSGIDYLKTEDEGRLLALPIEERSILRETLGLSPEKGNE